MADGHLGKCKECTKEDVKNNLVVRAGQYQEYEKRRANLPHRVKSRLQYAASEAGREAGRRAKDAWAERNPEKKAAATAAGNAVRDGKLVRTYVCAVCGSTKNVEAHHEDYSKPLEIVELCKKHHWEADRKLRPVTKRHDLLRSVDNLRQ
jgi:hypothetical protein